MSTPEWLKDNTNIKKFANKKEKEFTQTINSGSMCFDKGDIKSDTHMIEYKYTGKKSYSLKLDDLIKCKKQAQDMGKIPIFIVDFGGRFSVTIQEVFSD